MLIFLLGGPGSCHMPQCPDAAGVGEENGEGGEGLPEEDKECEGTRKKGVRKSPWQTKKRANEEK